MITYPVDVANTKWAVWQISTSQLIGRNQTWPVGNGDPIPGLDPDYVYLLEQEDARPDFDPRIFRLEGNDTIDVAGNTITRQWQTFKRITEEITNAAENVEAEQMARHIRLEKEAIETRLVVSAILNHIAGQSMPPRVQSFALDYRNRGVKIWKNRTRLQTILTEIDAGQEPDLDAGWEDE